MNPLFLPFLFPSLTRIFNLNFLIFCDRPDKRRVIGEHQYYGGTTVSTPREPRAAAEPLPWTPTDGRTWRWPLPPAQKA